MSSADESFCHECFVEMAEYLYKIDGQKIEKYFCSEECMLNSIARTYTLTEKQLQNLRDKLLKFEEKS